MFKKFCKVLLIFSVIWVLISCKNFLSGSDLKKSIEQEILIAKSVCPEIISAEPTLSAAGAYKDSNIVITFSKPMDKNCFTDFSNISITDSDGLSLTEYYFTPKLSSDGKTLIIPSDMSKSMEVINGILKTIKVTVKKSCKDIESIPMKTDYVWIFKVNDKVDDNAPVFEDTSVITNNWNNSIIPAVTVDSNKSDSENFKTFLSQQNNLKDFFTNSYRTKSLYLKINAYDTGSGIERIYIKEKLLYSASGIDLSENNNEDISDSFTDFTRDEINISFSTTYNLSDIIADGIIKLTVVLEDRCGNSQEQYYYFIKDTSYQVDSVLLFADRANAEVSLQESNKYFGIKNVNNPSPWVTWQENVIYDEIFAQKVFLLDEERNILEEGSVTEKKDGKTVYKFESISNKKNYYVLSVFYDELGNTYEKECILYAAPFIVNYFSSGSSDLFGIDFNKPLMEIECFFNDKSGQIYTDLWEDRFPFETDMFFRNPAVEFLYENIDTFGFYSDTYNISKNELVYQGNIDSSKFTCEIVDTNNMLGNGFKFKVSIDKDYLPEYKNRTICVRLGPTWEDYFEYIQMETNQNTCEFLIPFHIVSSLDRDKNLSIGLKCSGPDGFYESRIGSDIHSTIFWYMEGEWNSIDIKNYFSKKEDIYPPIIEDPCFVPYSENSKAGIKMTITHEVGQLYNKEKIKHAENDESVFLAKIYIGSKQERELTEKEINALKLFNVEGINVSGSNEYYFYIEDILKFIYSSGLNELDAYLYLEDECGNYTYYKMSFINEVSYTFKYSEERYEDNHSFDMNKIKVEFENKVFNEKFKYRTINADGTYGTWFDTNTSISATKTDLDKRIFKQAVFSTIGNGESYPAYFYSGKVDKTIKNIIENGKLLTILHDQPVLVHTVTSPVNFEKNIQAWENWTDLDFKPGSIIMDASGTVLFDNYTYPEDDIPEGWYYAAIIYFADNTRTISTVFQK